MAIVGRLVQLKSNHDQIYEVKSYAANDGMITLRAIFDDY
jgi:hypothetical protein